jgi:hypothetical protein
MSFQAVHPPNPRAVGTDSASIVTWMSPRGKRKTSAPSCITPVRRKMSSRSRRSAAWPEESTATVERKREKRIARFPYAKVRLTLSCLIPPFSNRDIRGPIYLCFPIFPKIDLTNKYRKRSRFRVKTTHFGSPQIGDDKGSDACLRPYPEGDPGKYSLSPSNSKD